MDIKDVKIAEAGRYLEWGKVVADKLEQACEAVYGIVELTPIVIVYNPVDCAIVKGSKANFSVRVLDDTGVSYQWQYLSTAQSASWTNSSAASGTTKDLTFNTSNTSYNGYQYRCILTKGDNRLITTPVTLTVTNS